jgi:hypothetical protein
MTSLVSWRAIHRTLFTVRRALLYIQNILNILRNQLNEAELQFIQDVASVFAPIGMPASIGRLYGYLLLKQSPMSLDQIALDLSMSKGSAWNGTRHLERYGFARRLGEPGGKRAFYAPSENFGSSFTATDALLAAFGSVLQNGANHVAVGEAAVRLAQRAKFSLMLREAIATAVSDLSAMFRAGAPADAEALEPKKSA